MSTIRKLRLGIQALAAALRSLTTGAQAQSLYDESVLRYYFAAYAGNTVGYHPTTGGFRPFDVQVAPGMGGRGLHGWPTTR